MADTIEPPYYPIVYVRGYAMTAAEREATFNDAYYGFAATSVEKREVSKEQGYFAVDVFEGQLIRFMKQHGYADAANRGLELLRDDNPSRSIWISRFYDKDVLTGKVRGIEDHARDLDELIRVQIPRDLAARGVDLGPGQQRYKVILIAHSMGGLVCRTLLQNLLSAKKENPSRWVHRLVTIGTPHGGIDLGAVPDLLEHIVAMTFNPGDSNIFDPTVMRRYLNLGAQEDARSLGTPPAFPPARCLCVIGSDYHSYGVVRKITGDHSDGLVKQDRAYVLGAFTARVHRAHSGYRGIVNSYESFENIRRFLFGNIKVGLRMEAIDVRTVVEPGYEYFYDFEFRLSVRNTGVYLHERRQDPCENAWRVDRPTLLKEPAIELHTGFMSSQLKTDQTTPFSHFLLQFGVIEHRTKPGILWDREYPERRIYSEAIEVRVGDADPTRPGDELQYRWLSDATNAAQDDWVTVEPDDGGRFSIPLRKSDAFSAKLQITAEHWPAEYA
jgi:pimeloyl-ACP methyl ester carboxylesterase